MLTPSSQRTHFPAVSVARRGCGGAPRLPSILCAVLAASAGATACPAYDPIPCFPASSAAPLEESEGGFSRQALAWEIDKMPALVDAPESDAAPSAVFVRAQRDMRTEFWADAAREFLSVVRGDTPDGKRLRQYAQYDLAFCLFRLRYFEEAKRIFRFVAGDPKHPRSRDGEAWVQRKVCPA